LIRAEEERSRISTDFTDSISAIQLRVKDCIVLELSKQFSSFSWIYSDVPAQAGQRHRKLESGLTTSQTDDRSSYLPLQHVELRNATTNAPAHLFPPLDHILYSRANNHSCSTSRSSFTRWAHSSIHIRPTSLCLEMRTSLRRARQMFTTIYTSYRQQLFLYRFATHSLQ